MPAKAKYILLRVLGGDGKNHFEVDILRFGVWKLRGFFQVCGIGLFGNPGINLSACCYHGVPKYQILQDLL